MIDPNKLSDTVLFNYAVSVFFQKVFRHHFSRLVIPVYHKPKNISPKCLSVFQE